MAILTYKFDDQPQLSPHFNAREFRCQCGKTHETLIASKLVDKLEQLYSTLNCSKIIVTSGYRCPEHDKAVGGTSSGQHTKGTAADVCCYGQDGQPISSKTVLPTSQVVISTRIWMCGQHTAGLGMKQRAMARLQMIFTSILV